MDVLDALITAIDKDIDLTQMKESGLYDLREKNSRSGWKHKDCLKRKKHFGTAGRRRFRSHSCTAITGDLPVCSGLFRHWDFLFSCSPP